MSRRCRGIAFAPVLIAACLLAGSARAQSAGATPLNAVEIGWRIQETTRSQAILRESIRDLKAQIANAPEGDRTRVFHWIDADGLRRQGEMTRAQALQSKADLETALDQVTATSRQLEAARVEAERRRAANAEHLADVLTARPPG